MRTKFKIDVHKSGSDTDMFVKAIAAHNEGKVFLSLGDFISFYSVYRAIYLLAKKDFYVERDEMQENIVRVTEDGGKTWTLTIEEIELEELIPEPQGEGQPAFTL